jgi:single-strand DNA-binding protein
MNNLTCLATVVEAPSTTDERISCLIEIPPYKQSDPPSQLLAWTSTKAKSTAEALGNARPEAYFIFSGRLRIDSPTAPPELELSDASPVTPAFVPGTNAICLVGRAGRDPEVRYLESGSVVANLSLAVNRPRRDEDPDWFNLEIWGKQAQVAADYVRKGSLLGITGSFELDHWTDRASGEQRSKPVVRVTRLDLLGSRRDTEGAQ